MCPDNHDSTFLNTAELAKKLGLRPQTIRKWRVLGRGPAYVRLGRGLRSRALYHKETVEAWLREKRFNSTAAEATTHKFE